jgi:hypothetical protein
MAGLDILNPKHEPYVEKIKTELENNGFLVDNWGLEKIAPQIRASELSNDFSLPALKLRSHYDLLVRHKETGFICEVDGKTVMFRDDTGKVAIEVWPILFGRKSDFPRLLIFEAADDYGIWLDKLEDNWFTTVFMPDRWDTLQILQFSRYIQQLSPQNPYYIDIKWEKKKASGDPFFSWPITKIKKTGDKYLIALLKRATGFKEKLWI